MHSLLSHRLLALLHATESVVHPAAEGRRRGGALRRFLEALNFLVTNRLPRRFASRLAGRLAAIESPLFTRLALPVWEFFGGSLELHEADRSAFRSLEECFTRQLRAGARPIDADPDVLASPCDAIVGACGRVQAGALFQAKGMAYSLYELVQDRLLADRYQGSVYVTLRLRSTMYHRFHAPDTGTISHARFISGDCWNVNPATLARVQRLFCRNERVVVEICTPDVSVLLVPVAAILVASLVLHGVPHPLDLTYRGPNELPLSRQVARGEELGYFRNGSTILVFAAGESVALASGAACGRVIRMGTPLFRRTQSSALPLTPSRST